MSVAVVHLVRRHNGTGPLRRFLASYRAHPAGIPHELVLVLKGYVDGIVDADVQSLAREVEARLLPLPDRGLDIGTYFAAAAALDHRRLCFVNSFTVVQADQWLAKLHAALEDSRVGLAGATGSYQSVSSFALYELGWSTSYAAALSDRHEALREWNVFRGRYRNALSRRLPRRLVAAGRAPYLAAAYPFFPDRYIRTNGFIVDRTFMGAIQPGRIRTKAQALRYESGRRNMTRRVQRLGLDALVVGADGNTWPSHRWHESGTFWQSGQQNLLFSDNRTEQYAQGDAMRRWLLARLAWGPFATGPRPDSA